MSDKHPVQSSRVPHIAPSSVTMAAYEVYSEIHGKQEALVTGNCRGGFSVSELIAFLYARSFPRKEWDARANEAFDGMKYSHVYSRREVSPGKD